MSAAATRVIAGLSAAARAATWAARAVGVLGRALRPLRSARRAISERCVPTCGVDHTDYFLRSNEINEVCVIVFSCDTNCVPWWLIFIFEVPGDEAAPDTPTELEASGSGHTLRCHY